MGSPPQGIDYEQLQQDAMRGVVRAVLKQVADNGGLVGDHHFYISFLTQAPGVILSKRLREKYPQEMTIVMQHRFWDLIVTEPRFEVKLTFDGIPERLVVPFTAIKVFIDPSVNFGMQFDDTQSDPEPMAPLHTLTMDAAFDSVGEAHAEKPTRTVTKRPRATRKNKPARATTPNSANADNSDNSENVEDNDKAFDPADADGGGDFEDSVSPAETSDAAEDEDPAGEQQANVVSLDAFRKKST